MESIGVMLWHAREACALTGVSFTQISSCCNNRKYSKTAGGFKWSFNDKQKE